MGRRDTSEELFTKMRDGTDEGNYEATGNDGRFRLVAYKKISLPHESKPYLYIRSSIPLASAISKANAAMLKNLSVFVSLFLIGLFLAWLIGKRVIVNPVMMLKGGSEQLAAGADTVHVSHAVKGGELGELARSFDGMAEALVQRETALRESEKRFRRYFELGLIGMAVTSPAKGIIEVNDELCKILGHERGELLQKTWAELTHPEDLAADIAQFDRAMAGEIDGYD